MFENSISTTQENLRFRGGSASVLLHCALAVILYAIAVPESIEQRFDATSLYLPPGSSTVTHPRTTPHFKRVPWPRQVLRPAPKLVPAIPIDPTLKTELALPDAPAIAAPSVLQAALNLPLDAVTPRPPAAPRKPEIHTGAFESTLMAVSPSADIAIPLRTWGFDTATVQAPKSARSPVAANGAFSSVQAIPSRPERGLVASTEFGAVAAVKPSPPAATTSARSALPSPLEILSKPRPMYTEEARRLHIEGDVVLQVSFRASSEVCVLRVLHGLGHGLDENAISAASAIRFQPATAGGRPIDDVAIVRITFQLAE